MLSGFLYLDLLVPYCRDVRGVSAGFFNPFLPTVPTFAVRENASLGQQKKKENIDA